LMKRDLAELIRSLTRWCLRALACTVVTSALLSHWSTSWLLPSIPAEEIS